MKRSLIALAVSTAIVAPAAMAGDVTVYGIAQVEIANVDDQAQPSLTDGVTTVDNANGRVGFKASEDLGGGLTGLAKFELKADTANGGITGARESMVGLKGGFGQFELGNLKSAYKYSGGVKYDPFVATMLEARGNGGMVAKPAVGGTTFGALGQSAFHAKTLGYRGAFGPVKVGLTYGPSENDGSMTAAAKFSNAMMEAFVAIVDSADLNAVNSYSATKIGGQFRMAGGAHKISAQYEMGSTDTGVVSTDPTNLFVGYQGKFGKNLFVAQFGTFDEDTGAAVDASATYLAIGAIHKFSKMTRVFGGFRSTDADDDSGEDVISVGLRKDF